MVGGGLALPYIEQGTLHDRIDFSQSVYAPINLEALALTSPGFIKCPSDEVPEFANPEAPGNGAPELLTSSYFGCGGSWKESHREPVANGSSNNAYVDGDLNGMFSADVAYRIRDCEDGTSNTLFIGESIYRGDSPNYLWNARFLGAARLSDGRPARTLALIKPGNGFINDPPTSLAATRESFSSRHPGGAQFALSDGSARFVSETIEHTVTPATDSFRGWSNSGNPQLGLFQRLLGRNDGGLIGDY